MASPRNFLASRRLYHRGCRRCNGSSLELQTIRLPSTESTIAFTKEGDPLSETVFVALHGGPGSHNDFKYLSPALKRSMSDRPYQLIRFDLPGYGGSQRLLGSCFPSSLNFSSSITEALDQLDVLRKKQVIMIGHSLGGHIAVEIASQVAVAGVVLLSSVSCRPHKALGNEAGYSIARWLGLNTDNPVFGSLIQSYLVLFYKKILGFPKSAKNDEIVWTQKRVAHLHWANFSSQIKNLPCPILFAYALDDKLFEPEIFKELADLLKSKDNHKRNRIIEYNDGGHNIQKTKADALGQEIGDWISQSSCEK